MSSADPIAAGFKVFISYSRWDADFAKRLSAALAEHGLISIADRGDRFGAERQEERLRQLILEADAIIFLGTPKSAASPVCKWEVDEAASLNKRIIPAVFSRVETSELPEQIRELYIIDFLPPSHFETQVKRLVDALTADAAWVREHTRILELASRWQSSGRSEDHLLRGKQLSQALQWANEPRAFSPELTAEQIAFLMGSEEAEMLRNSNEQVASGAAVFSKPRQLKILRSILASSRGILNKIVSGGFR